MNLAPEQPIQQHIPWIAAGAFLLAVVLESVWPLRSRRRPRPRRWLVNFCLAGTSVTIGALVVTPLALAVARAVSEGRFGALHWIQLPGMGQVVAGFILMDLSFYYWHRANHSLSYLWRFHNVHHI